MYIYIYVSIYICCWNSIIITFGFNCKMTLTHFLFYFTIATDFLTPQFTNIFVIEYSGDVYSWGFGSW